MSAGFQIGSGREQAAYSGRDEFLAGLDWTIERARRSLLDLQHHEGYWNAALEAPAQMNAEFIIFNHFMDSVDRDLEARIAKYLLETQQPDGSWNLFPGGEGYASYTIEAYAALKLAGMGADEEPLIRARRWIMANGGITRAGTLARFYLASIGLVPWSSTAACPVELMLLPNWFPLNIYELGSWARGTFVALALLQAVKPMRPISDENLIAELYDHPPDRTNFKQPRGATTFSMRNLLNQTDRILRLYDRHPLQRIRARAVVAAEKWLLDHQEANGSFGGIEPCYLLSAMALKAIGYRTEHPVISKSIEASRELIWEMGDKALYMPCVSPNWNTALACKALLASGMRGDHPAFEAATKWFIDHQVFARGDWSIKRPDLEPGGWPFEFFNNAYPDVDDSAVIVEVLTEMSEPDDAAQARAIEAGANWVSGMQSKDGGFAAFDTDTDSKWLARAGDAGRVGSPPRGPGCTARDRMAEAQPIGRGIMVGAMGRQSHLRHVLRVAGTARDRRRPARAVDSARG
jgi:squalene-hopene/tetraprenyl-beta-curcumene cyclase